MDGTNYRWRSPELGTECEVQLPQGRLHYHERGQQDSPTLVFSHGWLTNANIWRKVVMLLAADYRCITPDLPFGSHTQPLNEDADLTPDGCGQLIVDFLEALNISNVTLIGNDSGGAYSQIATAINSERIGRLILTACETPFDPFPPSAFTGLVKAAKASEEGLRNVLETLRKAEFRARPEAYGLLAKYPLDLTVSDSFVFPTLNDVHILRDARKVFASASQSYVEKAGDVLISRFESEVLFLWPTDDKYFPIQNVHRYASALHNAKVQMISDSYAFTAEDQPRALAHYIKRS
jgi:pimeloyl-ACP methyl ester carboxylesterase